MVLGGDRSQTVHLYHAVCFTLCMCIYLVLYIGDNGSGTVKCIACIYLVLGTDCMQGCVYNYIRAYVYLVLGADQSQAVHLSHVVCFALCSVYMYNFLVAWRRRYYVHNNMCVYLCV